MPPRSDRPRLRFLLAFALLLGPSVAAYWWSLPVYSRAVVGLANPLLDDLEQPLRLEVDRRGRLVAWLIAPGGGPARRLFDEPWDPHAIYLGLVLFPAMLLATPMEPRRRALGLVVGLPPLFLLHVACVYGLFRTHQCLAFDPANRVCDWTRGLVLTGGQVGAFVLWGTLSWSFWFPDRMGVDRARDGTGRNEPCPCGSGRKFKRCCGASAR